MVKDELERMLKESTVTQCEVLATTLAWRD
jgi:hypothetical protein